MLPWQILSFFLLVLVPVVVGQTTHIVTVGVEGSFFNPETVSAGLGDIVTFVFGGDFHSVTQSSFEAPCIPLEGGFNSGFQGRGAQFSSPTPFWNLMITNISEPIWYFCEASVPSSHCETGMVGVINPPSIEMFLEYVTSARAVTSTPKPTPTFVASGVGAIASASPALSSAPLSSVLSLLSFTAAPTPSANSTDIPASGPSPSAAGHSSLSTGLIAGIASAGGLVLLALIASAYYFGRTRHERRAARPPRANSDEDLYGHPKERERERRVPAPYSAPSTPLMAPASPTPVLVVPPSTGSISEPDDSTILQYSNYSDSPVVGGRQRLLHAQSSSASVRRFGPRPIREEAIPEMPPPGPVPVAPQVDISALVKEVVSVLRHAPSSDREAWSNDEPGDPVAPSPARGANYRDAASRWYELPEGGQSEDRHSAAPPYI